MKKILFILISLLGAALFNGCSDMLEEENIRQPVADTYYTTPEGFEDLVDAAYPYIRRWYAREEAFTFTTFGTDIWLAAADGSWKPYNLYDAGIQPSNSILWNIWNEFYLGISSCNAAIDRAPNVVGMNETTKAIRVAEAKFMRAMFYHIMVMQWGGVPLRINEVTKVETEATRATEAEVYNQIIKDLLDAESVLPATTSHYGRATKPAAQALLARVYLTIGKNAEAATYAKKVINDYSFALVPDVKDLWDITKQKNSEVIWAVQHTVDERLNNNYGNRGHLYFLMEYDIEKGLTRDVANGRPWKRFMPTRYFIDMLQNSRENDSRFDKLWKTAWYANVASNTAFPNMKSGDTALYVVSYIASAEEKAWRSKRYNFYDVGFYYGNDDIPDGKRSRFPSLNKHIDPNRPTMQHEPGSRDWFVFRLAEMHLIAAEALMKDNKKDEGVIHINKVRERAAWPGKEAAMRITAGELTLDKILEERALELCGEMFRWPDLKRTGTLIDRVKKYNIDGKANIKDFHLYRPIPQNEIDRVTNKDGFKQNDGY
jgi:hypothetical protein